MRIALFGPGRIGAALIPSLEQEGHTVTVLTREDYGDLCLEDLDEREANVRKAVEKVACDVALILVGRFLRGPFDELIGEMTDANFLSPMALGLAVSEKNPQAHIIYFLDGRIDWELGGVPADTRAYLSSKKDLGRHIAGAARDLTTGRVNAIALGPVLAPPDKAHSEKAGTCLTPRPTLADVAAAVKFLINCPSVTGQILYIDGGQHLLG